ncbi:MAG: hypothetical protein J6D02_01825 [Lachnospira sp.]|nr:hypothetical protein [Lachnospira sp.]
MNRWKNFIALLLILVITITTGMITYVDAENQNNGENSTTASGEGSGAVSSDASGDISGDASGEGKKEYVTISFYNDGKLVKMVQVERGSTVEWWEPEPYSDHYIFKGWYYQISGNQGIFVTKTTNYDKDIKLHAYWEHNWRGPVDPINLEEKRQEFLKKQEEVKQIRIQTYKADIKIKNITIKKKGKLTLKIRSTRMSQSPIELQYSTSKKFIKGKTKTKVIKRVKNTSVKKFKKVTIKKLKKNKTYYIRARVKSEYNGQTFCSKWSKVQKVKMKKKQIKKK